MRNFIQIILIAIVLLLTNTIAISATCTGNLNVTAEVIPVCVVKSSTLILQGQGKCSVTGMCSFDIICTNGSNADILLNKGEHCAYSGDKTRALQYDKTYVSYDLYSDAACQNIWDENYTLHYSSKSGVPYAMTIYAKVFLDDKTRPGIYKDRVMINPSCPGAVITPGMVDVILIVPETKPQN
jgi:spore coat protein U-like protein